jgi:uncharacterized protein
MALQTARDAVALAIGVTGRETPGQRVDIVFFGGEPLLRRDLIAGVIRHCERVTLATGQRFGYFMPTNGLLLDAAFLDDPDTGRVSVSLSIDGTPAAHDSQRIDARCGGSWAAAERAASLLLDRQPDAMAQMTVTPFTARWYAPSVRRLYAKGFRNFNVSLDHGGRWEPRHFRTLARQYELLADWYCEAYRNGGVRFAPFDHKVYAWVRPGGAREAGCHLAQRQISVAPSGRLYPCVQFVGDGRSDLYCIGHASTGLDDEARRRVSAIKLDGAAECNGCAIRDRCLHTCACQNLQATGGLGGISPVVCAHEQIVLPIADRAAARLYRERNRTFISAFYGDALIQMEPLNHT